jgi:hypothetical protein
VARLAGLFLFEFVVVLLGVLAAQAVAEWANDRRLGREAAAQLGQARRQAIVVARAHKFWVTVGACMSERARSVARAAANGETMTASAIGRPALPVTQMPTWDEEVRSAAFVHFGEARMNAIADLESRAEVMQENSRRIRDSWAAFVLLDPANGPPSDVDRGNVRLAAISVLDHIRLLGYGDLADEMDVLGVPRTEWEQVRVEGAPIDDCGLIRDWR